MFAVGEAGQSKRARTIAKRTSIMTTLLMCPTSRKQIAFLAHSRLSAASERYVNDWTGAATQAGRIQDICLTYMYGPLGKGRQGHDPAAG